MDVSAEKKKLRFAGGLVRGVVKEVAAKALMFAVREYAAYVEI